VLIGEGEARVDGRPCRPRSARPRRPRADRARAQGGLALINGTQVSTALALAGLFMHERALAAAFVAAR
jgi:histidine ammonia-lyase